MLASAPCARRLALACSSSRAAGSQRRGRGGPDAPRAPHALESMGARHRLAAAAAPGAAEDDEDAPGSGRAHGA